MANVGDLTGSHKTFIFRYYAYLVCASLKQFICESLQITLRFKLISKLKIRVMLTLTLAAFFVSAANFRSST